jgi:hypothetical protein
LVRIQWELALNEKSIGEVLSYHIKNLSIILATLRLKVAEPVSDARIDLKLQPRPKKLILTIKAGLVIWMGIVVVQLAS